MLIIHRYAIITCLIGLLTWCPQRVVTANYLPRFVDSFAAEIVVRVKEGPASIQSPIYHLRGEDADGDKLHFGVLGPFAAEYISIESTSATEADVFLRKELDRETRDSYSFVLTLSDGKLGKNNYITKSMLIIVEDVNDNEPVFRNFRSTMTLSEQAPIGTTIDVIEAVDADEGRFGQILYHLKEMDKEMDQPDKFSIETRDGKGVIKLIGSLDYETKSLYQLNVTATDRAVEGQQKSTSVILLVKVEDAEDEPPIFTYVPAVTRVPENLPSGSEVFRVRAVDGDRGLNKPIGYQLTRGPTDYFTVNSLTGVVTLKKKLDRESLMAQHADLNLETRGSFTVGIMAIEQGSSLEPQPSAMAEVTVIVTDVNDEAPQFARGEYVATIPENSQPGTPITFSGDPNSVRVFDHDQGKNGTFSLAIDPRSINTHPRNAHLESSGALKSLFTVTPTIGINDVQFMIRVDDHRALDYEQIKSVTLTLVATETVANNRQSSSTRITINLVDVNDNSPQFEMPRYAGRVAENATQGTHVVTVKASDRDSGQFGSAGIRYVNLTGEFAQYFHLDPMTGAITVSKSQHKLDRERVPEFYLNAEAADDAGRGNRNHVQVAISVTDANDNRPRFLQNRYEARITENHLEFQTAVYVTAVDDDQMGTPNAQLRYTITSGDPDNHFAIDAMTGQLKVRRALDYEQLAPRRTFNAREFQFKEEIKNFTIMVRATDFGSPPLWSDAPVIIYVFDENDNSPIFVRSHYYKSIPEDIRDGSMVLQVQATDADGSPSNSKVFYRILSGAADKFVIDPNTGVVSVANGASLDPDRTSPKRNNYLLNVVAIDHGFNNQRSSHATVNITVVDVNNKPPELIIHPGYITTPENSPKDMFVTRVAAVDPDESASLRFSINYNRSEAFNEHGQLVDDPAYLTAFRVDPDDGTIRIAGQIDREKCEVIKLNLVVEDMAATTDGQVASATISIKVGDVNDERPIFKKPFYRAMVTENSIWGTPIITMAAEDRDLNKALVYSLKGPQDLRKLVHIDEKTGTVTVNDKIDREVTPWINLTVLATDTGNPPLSGSTFLQIKVVDENDNNPVFVAPKEEQATFWVREDAALGTVVGAVQAIDADEGSAGKVTYVLDSGMVQGKFRVDRDSGVITVAATLDREEKAEYRVIIEAWDNFVYGHDTGESRRAFKQVIIRVTDFNDHIPLLVPLPDSCVFVPEIVEANELLTTLMASDLDDPLTDNARVRFDLLSGNENQLFALQTHPEEIPARVGRQLTPTEAPRMSSAKIITRRPLRGQVGNYTLTVRLQDYGTPSLTSVSPVTICVTDVNDHPPAFIRPPQKSIIRIPENSTIGTTVAEVEARDADHGENAVVRYAFKQLPNAHWRTFHINEITGLITLAAPLDRERQRRYELRVVASDLGKPTPLASDLDLLVIVTDVDDSMPEFTVDMFEVIFTENTGPGVESFMLPSTVDRDDEHEHDVMSPPAKSKPCYYLVGGDDRHKFSLDRFTHQLTLKEPLDREERDNYTLIVKAIGDCYRVPRDEAKFDPLDNTLLIVKIAVADLNDSPPKFSQPLFTGGITTNSEFGTVITEVRANDPDAELNGRIEYQIDGEVETRLSSGRLPDNRDAPFLIHNETGEIMLNFVPQKDMTGMFEFDVLATDPMGYRDPDNHADRAHVKIYLLREDQRVRFVLRLAPHEFREKLDQFRRVLSQISGATVSVDSFKYHENKDGSVDHKKTSLLTHFVDPNENEVLDVNHVLNLIDKNEDHLDELYKEFNVLITEPASMAPSRRFFADYFQAALLGSNFVLLLLLFMVISICVGHKNKMDRQLKAATATAFGGGNQRIQGQNAPNTNQYAIEGSNPMWLSAYGKTNELFKGGLIDPAHLHDHHHPHPHEPYLEAGLHPGRSTSPSDSMNGSVGANGYDSGNSHSNDRQALCRSGFGTLGRVTPQNIVVPQPKVKGPAPKPPPKPNQHGFNKAGPMANGNGHVPSQPHSHDQNDHHTINDGGNHLNMDNNFNRLRVFNLETTEL